MFFRLCFLMSVVSASFALIPVPATAEPVSGHAPGSGNPITPGYFADPSVLEHDGRYYLYATLDPWGGDTLGCWESTDFANWTHRPLNWPTKAACTSPTSASSKVWAPSVVRAADGRFHLFVSVGSEIWTGVAEHPLGPWRNPLGDRPLIPGNFRPGFHMIDAEVFVDDDGAAYLYWGSGWEWKNGRCWAARLGPDLASLVGEVRDVTPPRYFEAPFMWKRGGRYFLTYSDGRTDQDSYQVHYAVADNPFGPFTEPAQSPILVTDRARNIIAPGHHAIFTRDGRDYIAYHRHAIPWEAGVLGRQLCIDELSYTADNFIEKVVPTHEGPGWLGGLRRRHEGLVDLAAPEAGAAASASSRQGDGFEASRVLDDNYATRWAAAESDSAAWLRLDLGAERRIERQELRLEYPWKHYGFGVEGSLDGVSWELLAAQPASRPAGSPFVIERPVRARHLRIVFDGDKAGAAPAVWAWSVFGRAR